MDAGGSVPLETALRDGDGRFSESIVGFRLATNSPITIVDGGR